jgi:hypothetical protein
LMAQLGFGFCGRASAADSPHVLRLARHRRHPHRQPGPRRPWAKHVRQARQDTRVDDRPGFRIIGSPVSIAFISARFAARRSSQSSCVNDRLKLRENQRFEIAMIV